MDGINEGEGEGRGKMVWPIHWTATILASSCCGKRGAAVHIAVKKEGLFASD